MRVITPLGKILNNIVGAVPVVEQEIRFNGRKRRLFETAANGFGSKPTGVVIYTGQPQGGFGMVMSSNLYIGNLKPEKLQVIMRELAEKGYYDFSSMHFQKSKEFDGQVIDGGQSLPYDSEHMSWAFPMELNSMLIGCGCGGIGNFCSNDIFSCEPVCNDEVFDREDEEDC